MNWIKANDRLGDFKDSDIPHWKFFNCDFAKVDGKPVERPFFRKDIECGKIVFSYKGLFGSNELPESEFHRIVWLDEQDEGWVPVSSGKLPKATQKYFLYNGGLFLNFFRFWPKDFNGNSEPVFVDMNGKGPVSLSEITHWRVANIAHPDLPPATKD